MWATVELLLLAAVYAAGSYQGAQNAINSLAPKAAINAPRPINGPINGLGVGP
jgi:hypothetical protein